MLRWLRDHDYLNNSNRKTTHTLMTGGVVGVPDEAYDEFLNWYATEVKSKNKTLSFSELRSDPVFCMYFDIDMLDTCITTTKMSSRIFDVIQSVIKTYYSGDRNDDRFRCVVCDTTAKEVVAGDNKTTLIKNGYHITYPNLRVSLEQALQMRYSVVYELEKTMGRRPEGLNAWSDVIDRAPYTNGLKMCGSFKRVKCTDCKKTDPTFKDKKKALLASMAKLRRKIFPRDHGFDYADLSDIHTDEFKDKMFGDMYGTYLELTGFNSCQTCLNSGKIIENRTYMPSLVLDGGGDEDTSLLDVLHEDYFELMKYTSIRCQEDEAETPGFTIPKGVPKAPTEQNGANMRSFSTKKLSHLGDDMRAFTVNNDMYLSDAQTLTLWTGPRVEDQKRLSVIEKFVRGGICESYSQVQIRKVCESKLIKKVTSKANGGSRMISSMVGAHSGTMPPSPAVTVSNRYLVNIAGVGSTYCMNKGAEHTSNSVYFIITPTVCFQKCFSRKSDVRNGGTTCAEYKSGGIRVPVSVAAALFPDEVDNHLATNPLGLATGMRGKSSVAKTSRNNKRRKIDWGTKKL
jgi:hypothetical protein